jgi:hypothetical protein
VPPIVVHAAGSAGDQLSGSVQADARLAALSIRVIGAAPPPNAPPTAAYGRLSAVLTAFEDGADIVASLPSTCRMFRTTDLTAALRQQFRQGVVRYRCDIEPKTAWRVAVRTVWPGLHDDHMLWRIDGLTDNLPLFGKGLFQAFTRDLIARAAPVWTAEAGDDPAWPIAARLGEGGDPWGAYLAYRLLACAPPRLLDLSAVAALAGIPPDASGDPWHALRLTGHDRRLLRALEPSHLPLTRDGGFLALARSCLPAHVCLMLDEA